MLVADTQANAAGIGLQKFASEIRVADRGGHEDIGLAPTLNQVTRDFRPLAYHPLGSRGFMIQVASIDVRAVIQQELAISIVLAKCNGI